jgi:hypothetical protein
MTLMMFKCKFLHFLVVLRAHAKSTKGIKLQIHLCEQCVVELFPSSSDPADNFSYFPTNAKTIFQLDYVRSF